MKSLEFEKTFQEIDLKPEDVQGESSGIVGQQRSKKVLICIDNGVNKSTSAAFCLASKNVNRNQDKVYVVNIYSSWDYLNDEKNAGKMMLEQYARLCKIDGMKLELARQIESDDPQGDLLSFIEDLGIDEVYIGETSFTSPSGQSNPLFTTFSFLKQKLYGSMSEYLLANCKCRCLVVPDSNVLHDLDLIPSNPEEFVKTASGEFKKGNDDII